ncbi:hypothetical protein A2303_06865 [Candidatus Falkowbacteria bacterium RIFOXYB2_FULL_47_14]|uniref:Uncharacterized protein n=1 Tax=Candidatus Falkowbacteria bacterium RIFOXYA2_FULL_47_19 TaxID=1797994 RepID=A0A1F5SGA5_9BACT|nr:MAG: hypothetical protein A2227_00610 [Candidatus Falkowbacteria bacterium RIFOXYA2_FULL_47_19]OGF35499.1 MAG: hypothetical protein A2468_05660 [Candidatus Falkowbacteria bacterium RIFOXYC2_FULL_46_15]OGF43591.1 MAG: hypothetical protein A2303_06865 [Candidatus Falkowbacteria bacterium RIFOXYB2_FULL_47_14]
MKKFYLKKLDERGKIAVWQVDGASIRNKIDIEFTNFGHHYRNPYIPKYEFWLDREADFNEEEFYITHLLADWELMKKGYNHWNAGVIAEKKEAAERRKSKDYAAALKKNGQPAVEKIHVRLLQKTANNVSVWVVRGRLIRNAINIEFSEGGHDLVYDFIPKNEVWIDNDIYSEERLPIILHELYERTLMMEGLKYLAAHRRASRLEYEARNNKKILKSNLALLGWK